MVKETHKIWGEKDIAITATCIRVPIMRAHAESINLEFEKDISEEQVQTLSPRHGAEEDHSPTCLAFLTATPC